MTFEGETTTNHCCSVFEELCHIKKLITADMQVFMFLFLTMLLGNSCSIYGKVLFAFFI